MSALMNNGRFPEELVTDMFSKVNGHSAIARLSAQKPLPFNGEKSFIFDLEGEAAIVGEGEVKPSSNASLTPKVVRPIKFIYQSRISDEFKHAADEVQLNYLQAFADGFSKKIARGLDLAAFHGVNPRTNTALDSLASNNFDGLVTANVVTYDATAPDDNLDAAVQLIVASNYDPTGVVIAPAFGAAMAKVKVNGVVQYPEFRFGGAPASFYGYTLDMNRTLSTMPTDSEETDYAIVGDFQNMFRWGYAKNMPLEIIEYGDPDNAGRDLKAYNEILLRTEAFIGWGIMDATAFARIKA